jgi:branched-chain amino acid transport system permease protein
MSMQKTATTTTHATPPAETPLGVWDALKKGLGAIGFSPIGMLFLIIVGLLPLVPPFNQEHMVRWLVMGALLAAQAVAFDFTAGYINVVNFGFAAFVGLGAYTSAILSSKLPFLLIHPGWPTYVTIPLGALVAGIVGIGLGVLTLRLRGIFAAVMAWFVGIALMGLATNLTTLTRGSLGFAPQALLTSTSNVPYFYVIFGMLVLTYVVLRVVTKTRLGLAFRAIGQNIDAARASGINPTYFRIINFTLSCVFAGLLGGFYAHYIGSMTPKTVMHTSKTVEVLALAYIGGRGSLWGGAAVAFPFVFFIEYLRSNFSDLPGLHLVIYGLLMILVMIFYPGGFAQLYQTGKAWVQKMLFKK